jgi:hypothetical protein
MLTLAKTIELYFWDTTIVLLSESELVRKIVKNVYDMYHDYKSELWITVPIITCGVVGLVVGRALLVIIK